MSRSVFNTVAFLVMLFVSVLYGALALDVTWGLVIEPHGFMALPYSLSLGVVLVADLLSSVGEIDPDMKPHKRIAGIVVKNLLAPTVTMLVALVISLFL